MRVYVAGPYVARDMLRELIPYFVDAGHEVTSTWLQGTRTISPGTLGASLMSTNEEVHEHASSDLEDIDASDALVHFNSSYIIAKDPSLDNHAHQLGSGGRHVETGYALARNKPVVVIGKPENVFQRGLCVCVPSLGQALARLG